MNRAIEIVYQDSSWRFVPFAKVAGMLPFLLEGPVRCVVGEIVWVSFPDVDEYEFCLARKVPSELIHERKPPLARGAGDRTELDNHGLSPQRREHDIATAKARKCEVRRIVARMHRRPEVHAVAPLGFKHVVVVRVTKELRHVFSFAVGG
jgi:hypothetical protein